MRRRGRTLLLASVTGLVLAGCAATAPQPLPQQDQGPVPAVADVQLDRVQADLEAVLAGADAAMDAELAARRVGGAALELRRAAYQLDRADPQLGAPEPVAGERLRDVVPVRTDWPRAYLTVTRADPAAVPSLLVLTQAGPREPYLLSAQVALLPGVVLPATDPPSRGVGMVPADTVGGLAAAPGVVAARYGDLLTHGDASQFAADFAPDAFRTQVLGEQAAEAAAVRDYYGYSLSHTPRPAQTWALRTGDSGAIVVSVLDGLRTFAATRPGAGLPLPRDLAVLAGAPAVTTGGSVHSVEMVAFAVPPTGSVQPVEVLGAARGAVTVTLS